MVPLLDIRDLHLEMSSFDGRAKVLNGINLTVNRGEIWGLVGESGCGKSLTGLSVSRLQPTPPAHYTKGQIMLDGQNLLELPMKDMQRLRGKRIGMIFQDPTTNLNPSFRIGEQLIDVALAAHAQDPTVLDCAANARRREKRRAARRLAGEMLERVEIPDARKRLDSYPHEFSGGMRQRVLIAMAMIGRPALLIADEPTTALDVSVQQQILKLIKASVAETGMGVVLITHDLGVVAQTCSHVAVMYAGNIVESGPVESVIGVPDHPYTRALMESIPTRETKRGMLKGLAGMVPNLINPPLGCRFAPRCQFASPECCDTVPPPVCVGPEHVSACIRAVAMEDARDA